MSLGMGLWLRSCLHAAAARTYRPSDAQVSAAFNLYRAYVQLLLDNSFERRLPIWLSTGLGEVLGNTTVNEKEVWVGRPVPWELQRFNGGGRYPLQAIFDARSDSPLLTKEDQRNMFDAQCYALAHYLMFGDQGSHAAALHPVPETLDRRYRARPGARRGVRRHSSARGSARELCRRPAFQLLEECSSRRSSKALP
jgi:hypothetical protein